MESKMKKESIYELQKIDCNNRINELPFNTQKVGDLSYFDGALISVYQTADNKPVIYYWAERKQGVDRWMVFQVNQRTLADYVYGKSTNYELVNTPDDDLIFITDVLKDGSISSVCVLNSKDIPQQYLPDRKAKFNEEDSIGLERIISTFPSILKLKLMI